MHIAVASAELRRTAHILVAVQRSELVPKRNNRQMELWCHVSLNTFCAEIGAAAGAQQQADEPAQLP